MFPHPSYCAAFSTYRRHFLSLSRPLAGAGISVRILWWRKTFLRCGFTWLLHSDWLEAERAVDRAKPSMSRLCNEVLQYCCFRPTAFPLLYLLLLPGSQHHCLTLLVLVQRRLTPLPASMHCHSHVTSMLAL